MTFKKETHYNPSSQKTQINLKSYKNIDDLPCEVYGKLRNNFIQNCSSYYLLKLDQKACDI